MKDFRAQAEALRDEMVERRRDLHEHPELGFEEVRTAGIVAQELNGLGLEVQTGIGKTGVVGILEGSVDGPTVLVRCDMDALPIQEENDVEYRSQTAGKMHACGHDGHVTIALAVAKMLSARRDELQGRVKFIFQPAEEIGLGAKAMISDGVLLDPAPDVLLGLHLWNELHVGEVSVTPGGMMAGADIFSAFIKGTGAHAALPHRSADPVMTMVQIISALQTMVSRNVSPLDGAVFSITQVHAGHARNVIPELAEFHGTLRNFSPDVRELLVGRAHSIVSGIAAAMGCEGKITFEQQSLPVINDAAVAARLKRGFEQIAPELNIRDDVQTMAAEDVSFFLDAAPGQYFFVGSANKDRGLNYTHHHPRFDFDEEALVIGARLLASAAAEYVLPE